MRWLVSLFFVLAALMAMPADARVESGAAQGQGVDTVATRFVIPKAPGAARPSLAKFGPFRVLDETTAALSGATDETTPGAFAAMLEAYPQLSVLEFHDCPGTHDDRANLRLGRMIREAQLAAVVPAGGSVRSGAVELVLAGSRLVIDDRAQFAVHAWLDDFGREASAYSLDAPEHRKYFVYYGDMGMEADAAARFYAMTNSAAHDDPKWLTGAEMRDWLPAARSFAEAQAGEQANDRLPQLAYLDLGPGLN